MVIRQFDVDAARLQRKILNDIGEPVPDDVAKLADHQDIGSYEGEDHPLGTDTAAEDYRAVDPDSSVESIRRVPTLDYRLIEEVASRAGTNKEATESAIEALFEVVESIVSRGDAVEIPGWLKVERVERAPRTGTNPQTGEPIEIAGGVSIKLTAGSRLKAAADTGENQ